MLDADTLRSLDVSDVVEVGPLFAGLSTAQVSLHTAVVEKEEPYTVGFLASYMGIHMGTWVATIKKDKVVWSGIAGGQLS